MSITKIAPHSFKGRIYLNKNDLKKNSPVSYEQIKNMAQGQVIESHRKDGFYWIRLDDKIARPVANTFNKNNILCYYLPGEISYKEFEHFAHTTSW